MGEFLVAITVLVICSGLAGTPVTRVSRTRRKVEHTQQVLSSIDPW